MRRGERASEDTVAVASTVVVECTGDTEPLPNSRILRSCARTAASSFVPSPLLAVVADVKLRSVSHPEPGMGEARVSPEEVGVWCGEDAVENWGEIARDLVYDVEPDEDHMGDVAPERGMASEGVFLSKEVAVGECVKEPEEGGTPPFQPM